MLPRAEKGTRMADDPQHPDKLSRRELLRAAASASAAAALGVRASPAWSESPSALAQEPPVSTALSRSYPPEWTGRNIKTREIPDCRRLPALRAASALSGRA